MSIKVTKGTLLLQRVAVLDAVDRARREDRHDEAEWLQSVVLLLEHLHDALQAMFDSDPPKPPAVN